MNTYQITNPVKPGDEVVIPKGVNTVGHAVRVGSTAPCLVSSVG